MTGGKIWIGLQAQTPITCSCTVECADENCPACSECRRNFNWVDGSNAQYRNWLDSEPSNGDTGVFMTQSGEWGAKGNQNHRRSICEKGEILNTV